MVLCLYYLIIIYKIIHLLIIQFFLVICFDALVIALYIVCSQTIKAMQNNFLHSNSKTVKFKPNQP